MNQPFEITPDQAHVLNDCVQLEIATLTKDLQPLRDTPPTALGETRVVAALEGKLRMLGELSERLIVIAYHL